MKPSLLILALASVVVAASCKRANGAYCDDARPCPSGLACDLTARECHPLTVGGGNDMAGVSTDMAGCTCSGATPICVADTCVSCMSTSDPEGACAAVSPSTPHCASDGSCVGCTDASQCPSTMPYCDMNTHVCRGCVADSECTSSLVCDLTPNSTTHGVCIDASQVEYVDCGAATNGNGLTPTTPRQKLQDGINNAAVTKDNRPYVRVTGTCGETIIIGNAANVYIVGATGATVNSTMANKDGFGVQSGAQVTVRNLIITASGGNAADCSAGGVGFTAYRTQFINSLQLGVYSSSCELKLDGCLVSGNRQGGINIGAGDFTILNSIIVKNTGGTGMYQTATGATTVFVNNTVADNKTGGGIAGVHCAVAGAFTPVNTILYNNRDGGNMLQETDCMGAFMATDDTTAGPQSTVDLSTGTLPGFVGGGDYHLAAGSPCIDSGTTTMGAPNHDFDFEPRPDAKTMKVDIGADEVQQ